MSIDAIGDFLTIIRNGCMVRKRFVVVQHSKIKTAIVQVLKQEGYIKDFAKIEQDGKPYLSIHLKYVNGESVIHELTRISKPSRRYFERLSALTPVIGGLGVSILTTSSGVVTDKQAKKMAVGGEVICHVW